MDWGNPLIYVVGGVAATGGLCKLCLWIGGMNSFRATVGGAIEGIRLDIQEMSRDIKEVLRQLPSSTISGGSPLRLTDLGRAISEDIGARAWAREAAPGMAPKMQDRPPYEIQEQCFEYVQDDARFPEVILRKMRETAYNRGTTLNEVRKVLAVELRDVLLGPSAP